MAEPPPRVADDDRAEFVHTLVAGRFLVQSRVGRGGMGEVYRAFDTRLKRPIALKRLAPQLRNDPLYRRRFQEEGENASRLSDPTLPRFTTSLTKGKRSFSSWSLWKEKRCASV
jgi:serine/threonine protein kinase